MSTRALAQAGTDEGDKNNNVDELATLVSALTLGQTLARIPVPATAHWLQHPAH